MSRSWLIALSAVVVASLVAGIVFFANRDGETVAEPSPSPSQVDDGIDTIDVDLEDPTRDIVWLAEQGFFVPETDGSDRPDRLVDRSLLATVWARMREQPVGPCVGEAPVADVAADRENCSAIASAYARNVTGVENAESFRPDHRLTRAELARLLYLDAHPTGRSDACQGEAPFADVAIADERCEAMRWAAAAGYPAVVPALSDEEFEPIANVNLADFARAIRRYYELFVFEGSEFEYAVHDGVVVYAPDEPLTTERRIKSPARFLSDGTVLAPEIAEWSIVLSADSEIPAVGTGVFVEPGGEPTPEGLAGRVARVETQSDGTHLLTVEQVALDLIFETLSGFVAGPVPGYESPEAPSVSGASVGTLDLVPERIPLTGCGEEDAGAGLRGLNVSVEIPAPRMTVQYSLGSLTSEPFVRQEFYAEVSFSLSVEVAMGISCKVDLLPVAPSIPIAPPVTVGIMPFLSLALEVSAGQAEPLFEAKAYFSKTAQSTPGSITSKETSTGASFRMGSLDFLTSATITVEASVGIGVQVGIVGCVGIYLAAAIKAWVSVEMSAPRGGEQKVCYDQGLDLVLSVGVFFNLFFIGAELELASATIGLYRAPRECATIAPPPDRSPKPPPTPPSTGAPGNTGNPGGSTTNPPPPPKTLEEIRARAMELAEEAQEVADFALDQAAEARRAAEIAEAAAVGDAIAVNSAQHAAAAADDAAIAAAEARDFADEAYALATAAATKDQAEAALLLAQAALAYSNAAAAAVRAVNAAADAILEVKLPITHKDPTAPTFTIAAGDVWSLGPGDVHAYGDASRTPYLLPAKVPAVPDVKDVVTSYLGAFLVGTNGTVWTWGYGSPPTQVPGLAHIDRLWACENQLYALDSSGVFYAWGTHDGSGQIVPVAGASGSVAPTPVPEFTDVAQVECQGGVTSARTEDGDVWEWGPEAAYVFSEPYLPVLLPRQVPLASPAIDLSVTWGSSCAVLTDTNVWCWRQFMGGVYVSDPYDASYGNHWDYHQFPAQVVGLTDVVDVEIGLNTWFAITSDGTVYSWGLNTYYMLAQGKHDYVLRPLAIEGLPPIQELKSGTNGFHWTTIALARDGTVWSWGTNSMRGIGDGTSIDRIVPVKVPRVQDVVDIDFEYGGCIYALDADGTLWFWGDSSSLVYVGYDFAADIPSGASLRPVAITHFNNVAGFAFSPAQLFVWTD